MLTESKIGNFLEEELDDSDYDFMEDADLMEKMFDFISNLDTEKLSDEQIEQAAEITDLLADKIKPEGTTKEEEEVSEFAAKRVRINRSVRRKRKRAYKKKRAKLKSKARKFRKSAKFKRWKRLSKIKKRMGKTASGKRIRKFI